jgi:hypothetical protein
MWYYSTSVVSIRRYSSMTKVLAWSMWVTSLSMIIAIAFALVAIVAGFDGTMPLDVLVSTTIRAMVGLQ